LNYNTSKNILSQSTGTKRPDAIQNTIDLLEEQIATYYEMIDAEFAAYNNIPLWPISLIHWDDTDKEAILEWLADIEATEAQITALWQQYNEILNRDYCDFNC